MHLQHSHSDEATVVEVSAPVASRLAELNQARNADCVWRAGRKAEIDRQLKWGFIKTILFMLVLAGSTQQVLHWWVAPHLPFVGALKVSIAWLACALFGTRVKRWVRMLLEERKAYEEKPGDPVIWSTGRVIYSEMSEAAPSTTREEPIPERPVVWSTGTVISPAGVPDTPSSSV